MDKNVTNGGYLTTNRFVETDIKIDALFILNYKKWHSDIFFSFFSLLSSRRLLLTIMCGDQTHTTHMR